MAADSTYGDETINLPPTPKEILSFPEFPKEIRPIIWRHAIAGPRTVCVSEIAANNWRMRPCKRRYLDWRKISIDIRIWAKEF
jgi:hypothetical protein